MHSGRKFTNLVPSEGEIILPIRGERVLSTSEELSIDNDIQEKARKLEELLQKISQEEGVVIKKPQVQKPAEAQVDKEAEEVAERLKKQNEELNIEIKRLKDQIQKGKSSSVETGEQENLLKKLEFQKGDIASSYSELRKQVQDLQTKLDEKVKVSTGEEFLNKMKKQLPVLTDKPNVLTGVVRDAEGKTLGDTLLIVKNARGDTVRALKTNSLGQFVVFTPLQNGTYTVEVSPVNKTNLTFAIIPIEAKGEVIPTLDVVGR
jgi:myosin heavy subunit